MSTPPGPPRPVPAAVSDWLRWLWCRFRGAGTCDLRFSLQGRYPSVVDLRAFRIANTAVTLHGSALVAGTGVSESEFISTEEGAISTALNTYLERNGLIPGPGHLIILDMEPHYSDPSNPEEQISFSPGNLGRYEDDPELQSSLIRAYVRRILVAKEVLKQRWPAVKLGLYGVVVPDGRGEEDARFDQRMRGYRRAGELGMYDFVDSLVPVLYNRFGPSDVPLPGGDAYLERLNAWVGRSTRQALVNSQRLTRRNGRTVPLTPVLTFWVANGNSAHNDRVVAPETMSLQLAIVQEYCPVRAIVFWSGPETIEEMRESGRQPLQFVDFLARVEGLPPPRCR